MPRQTIATVTVPADYAAWLAELRTFLEANPGSRADLARHLSSTRDLKPEATAVRMSKILNQGLCPSADFFLAIAQWHAAQLK